MKTKDKISEWGENGYSNVNQGTPLEHLKKYRPLMKELVSRDLKVKYRRSVLGYLWSLLNPLMMMLIMTFVFSHAFRANVENYPMYLICGNVLWTFFNDSTNQAMTSILNNSSLIRKVYIPKFIFPVSRVISSFVTTLFSLGAILIVMVFTQTAFHWEILLFPIPMFFLFIFCVGMSLILSSMAVYFRDTMYLYGVVTLAWMYGTPIFYPMEALPAAAQSLIKINPMYHYINFFRNVVIYGNIPGINTWFACIASSLIALLIGVLVFRKLQKNFILYI